MRYNFGGIFRGNFMTGAADENALKTMLDSIQGFHDAYNRYLKRDLVWYKQLAKTNTMQKDSEKADLDTHTSPCTYNGFVKEVISPYKETSYVCYCTKGHLGEQCEISAGLFISTQMFIAKMLQEIIHVKPPVDDLLLMLTTLNKPKVDIQNLEQIMSILITTFDKKPLTMPVVNHLLKVVDYLIENAVEMLEEDDRNQIDVSHDIDYKKRKELTTNLINGLTIFTREVVHNSLDNQEDITHSDTYSFQLAIYHSNGHRQTDMKDKGLLKVQNPYMDNTALKKNSFFTVRFKDKNIQNNNDVTLWSYAHEMYRSPEGLHFVSNMIQVTVTESDPPNLYLEKSGGFIVNFPLRVLLPDTNLKEHFQCARIQIKFSQEIVALHGIQSLNEDTGNVECRFEKLKVSEFLVVVYSRDMKVFNRVNRYEIERGPGAGDDIQFLEESGSILFINWIAYGVLMLWVIIR